jgi:hypothetical protein
MGSTTYVAKQLMQIDDHQFDAKQEQKFWVQKYI